MIFNLIIGNHDAHAKNFSLLYLPDGSTRLAPLYDLVCTVFYPELTDRMAMKVGKEARSGMIFPQHIARFARDAGLAVPATVARVSSMASAILELLPGIEKPHQLSGNLAELIAQRCKTAIRRFKAK